MTSSLSDPRVSDLLRLVSVTDPTIAARLTSALPVLRPQAS